ncbi:MAG: Ca-activated chloride channel family protein [Bradymonadia bacterium]|jgi:Ca-activated chloride channel family protein
MSGLRIFVRPERRFVAAGRPTELVVMIRLLAESAVETRAPLNLGVVLDRSRSMGTEWYGAAIRGLQSAFAKLEPDDTVSMVAVGDTAEVLASAVPPGVALRALEGLADRSCEGRARAYPAWLCAAHEVAAHHRSDGVNRIWTISNGMGVVQEPDWPSWESAAGSLFRRGISTTTVGLGESFNEDALVGVAREGGGSALAVTDPAQLPLAFASELEAMRGLFAEWATLRLESDGCEVLEVLNDLRAVSAGKLALPPLTSGQELMIIARVRIAPAEVGTELYPLSIKVKSLDLGATKAVVHSKALRVHVVAPPLADSMSPDVGVQAQAARLELARTLRKCVRRIDLGKLDEAKQLLDFSLGRFGSISSEAGGTQLSLDLLHMQGLRDSLESTDGLRRARKSLTYAAAFAQTGGHTAPYGFTQG